MMIKLFQLGCMCLATISLSIPAMADAPYFGPRPAMIVNQGQQVNVDVTPIDPDGDSITVTATGLPPGMSLQATNYNWSNELFNTSTNIPYARGVIINANGSVVTGEDYPHPTGNLGKLYEIDMSGTVQLINGNVQAVTQIDQMTDGSYLYVSRDNHKIWRVNNGQANLWAGSSQGTTDGPRNSAQFRHPNSLVIDASDTIYLIDGNGSKLRKIDVAGTVSTVMNFPFTAYDMVHQPNGDLLIATNTGVKSISTTTGAINSVFSSSGINSVAITNGGTIYYAKVNGVFEHTPNAPDLKIANNPYVWDITAVNEDTVIVANGYQNNMRRLQKIPVAWAIVGAYAGSNCGGDFSVLITATDSNGETSQTSVNMTIPAQGPGCGGPPSGPNSNNGAGGKVVGNPIVVTQPGNPIDIRDRDIKPRKKSNK